MTTQDWTALAGDPLCTETMDDWAADMLAQLQRMPPKQMVRTVSEMTEEERDMIRERVVKIESIWS